MKNEEEIRLLYRSYVELYCSSTGVNKDMLYGALLAYGRILGFSAKKVAKDVEMARNKYY